MTIPDKLKVGGIVYEVKQIGEVDSKNANVDGQITYNLQEILIKSTVKEDYKHQVFLHELLHAVFAHCGLEDQDESVVVRLAACLYQVLKDNDIDFRQGGQGDE